MARNGDGTFQERSHKEFPISSLEIQGRGLIKADFDKDGRMDLLMTRLDGEPILLKNVAKGGKTVKSKRTSAFGGSYLSGVVADRVR